jgi:Mrp family chromosome partitioning ATPase
MPIRFHQSLPALVDIVMRLGIPIDAGTVFVRDGTGRLLVAREQIPDKPSLEAAIRSGLGAYGAPVAAIDGDVAALLIADPSVRSTNVSLQTTQIRIRFADRRIVGLDWMTPTADPPANGPARLVFGSLKGGVGRSTALSVLAADLAYSGKKVLTIDLDIEAPGVGFMLLTSSEDSALDQRPEFGAIDYLIENGIGGVADDVLSDFVGISAFADGSIHVVPAVGRTTDEFPASMIAKLSRALVDDVKSDGSVLRVADQVRELVERFSAHGAYDVVLIDSRAGLGEISAAPLLTLGAEILLFGTDQPQTFRGYRYMLSHLVENSGVGGTPDWRERISFVQAKAPAAASKRAAFREALLELCTEQLYDQETLDSSGQVMQAEFNPSPDERGLGVPHDSLHIEFHPDYDAFDPVRDMTQLDPEVYDGPFANFLTRCWQLLGLEKSTTRGHP